MRPLSHESLTVYQKAIEFVGWSFQLSTQKKITGVLLDQFKRAYLSIPLNIAEGNGKHSGRDQAKFYDIAKGSALECAACLDVLVATEMATRDEIATGKAMIGEIAAMLTGLARSAAGDRMREEAGEYETELGDGRVLE